MIRPTVTILLFAPLAAAEPPRRPNVVLIITDDQGYGDLGFHGNPKIRTPNLDRLAKQSVRLANFYSCPVCSPTRASLMTGRYNYRTGVVDTYIGRSLMHADETTIAEMLRDSGYRTGIFGKWHLGDNYPLRAIDQGFQEALVCKGGGLTQPSDPPGNSYFDPILMHNGKPEKSKGYCSDVFTDAAMKFIEQSSDKPFFAYLAYNAPHDPLQVDDKLVEPYRKMNLDASEFPKIGNALTNPPPKENTAKVYAMVENIDTNLGRLFKLLDDKKLTDDTFVIFLTDNGPAQTRWNSGLRGQKGTVFEGGLRVPCFMRWPSGIRSDVEVKEPAAHIDLCPTLMHACRVVAPNNLKLDGRSLLGLLTGHTTQWHERSLFFQWHRGDVPEKYRAFAVRGPRYKLVQPIGAGPNADRERWQFHLFDLQNDPFEQNDVAAQNPEIVGRMKKEHSDWFDDVRKTRDFAPPRIHFGSERENPVVLTRQDWRGPNAGWRPNDLGYWEVHVEQEAKYRITVRFAPRNEQASVVLRVGNVTKETVAPKGSDHVVFVDLALPKGDARIESWLQVGEAKVGMMFVEVSGQ